MKKTSFFAIVFLFSMATGVYAQNALEILNKMDNVMFSAKDMTAKQKIILTDKNGKQEVREAMIWQKGNNKRLFRFTSPASQAGVAFLSLPDDIIYLYMPAFGKERRIASSAKNQNFAGTDFSYDDMESKPFAEKYNPKLLKTEGNYYFLELTPKGTSDYSKIIVKVNKTTFCPESMESFDKGNNKVKVAFYKFKKIGNYWNAEEIEMTDLKKNHKTKMIMSEVKYDQNLSDDVFTVRNLKQ